ncbi:hypothetical protein ABU614_13680 [Lysobacter firmicutimachus]|uniref:Uncharacterized protein n=1 Tax=Lysobacter firmicutimachus TaxID=1792846 RepID=A0AAU8MQ92_9GAMM
MSYPGVDSLAARLRRAVNWQARLPDYVFNEASLRGFFVIESGVLTTKGFLDFMLSDGAEAGDGPMAMLVHVDGREGDEAFTAGSVDDIERIRIYLMQNWISFFGAIVVVSSDPSKWIAYEETAEDFAVLVAFDDQAWARWTSKHSRILDYVMSEEQIIEGLRGDEPLWWKSEFLKDILASYGDR